MNISPLDIRKHEFKKGFRGYDVDEVNAFLELVSMEYENIIRDNAMLHEKLSNYTVQLKKYHDIESTLQETLLSAERTREDTIKTAKKQAEVIIREAEVKAASLIEEGRVELSRLGKSITELKVHKETYIVKLKALVSAQMEIFDKFTFFEERKFENLIDKINENKMSSPKSDLIDTEKPKTKTSLSEEDNHDINLDPTEMG